MTQSEWRNDSVISLLIPFVSFVLFCGYYSELFFSDI